MSATPHHRGLNKNELNGPSCTFKLTAFHVHPGDCTQQIGKERVAGRQRALHNI